MAKLVAGTYGEALFEVAQEYKTVNTMVEEVKFVKEAFISNEELTKFLNHPHISKEEKVKVIENIFKNRVSNELVGLLVIIIEKGRYNDINGIFEYFIDRVREFNNTCVAVITSPMELSEKQKLKLKEKLLSTTKYKGIEMNYIVDNSLIGGLIIKIGDRVVDGSIKAKLAHLVKDLQKIQLS